MLRIALLIFLVIGGSFSVWTQESFSGKELDGSEFENLQRLKGLVPGVTSEAEVIERFGSSCEIEVCILDDQWDVQIYFFAKRNEREPRDPKFPRSVPIREFAGRLRSITLLPKSKISYSGVRFGKEWNLGYGRTVGSTGSNIEFRQYHNGKGLSYLIVDRHRCCGPKLNKGDLLSIEYGLRPQDEKRAFEEW